MLYRKWCSKRTDRSQFHSDFVKSLPSNPHKRANKMLFQRIHSDVFLRLHWAVSPLTTPCYNICSCELLLNFLCALNWVNSTLKKSCCRLALFSVHNFVCFSSVTRIQTLAWNSTWSAFMLLLWVLTDVPVWPQCNSLYHFWPVWSHNPLCCSKHWPAPSWPLCSASSPAPVRPAASASAWSFTAAASVCSRFVPHLTTYSVFSYTLSAKVGKGGVVVLRSFSQI